MPEAVALRLESRKNSLQPWGTLNTVSIEEIGNPSSYRKAKAQLDNYAMLWLQNYDPTIELRIIKLGYGNRPLNPHS